jgi:superfamily II DNA or RNA helicase
MGYSEESPEESPEDGAATKTGSPSAPFRLRAYQAEMVEESMKSNIICVMDTGSGKTHM